MQIIILPKGKDKKHHKIIIDATRFFIRKLLGKREEKRIRTITIRLMDSIDYGASRGECREVSVKDGQFDIFYRLLATDPLPNFICTLAHESIHAKQAVKGELILGENDDIWVWKGNRMRYRKEWYDSFTIAQQCDKLPWEKEAYAKEKPLAMAFFNLYYKTLRLR